MEPIPFFTGRIESHDEITAITAGTAISSFSADEAAAKRRRWSITELANPAFLPVNYYRSSVFVDNTLGGQEARIVFGGTATDAEVVFRIPTGTGQMFTTAQHHIGTGKITIYIAADDATGFVVTENSYE